MAETRLPRAEAEALLASALVASEVSEANARSVAAALVAAEIDGQPGHGLGRLPAYCAQARSGKVDGRATPLTERVRPAFLRVDAAHGFAFPALDLATEALADLAAETGVAAAGVVRSHHAGQMARHVERLAERGRMALMVANTPRAMAPWGGREALFGTNPIAFAAPRPDAPPLVIDLSLSKVARGKVVAAARRGEPIPEGWALDAEGRPTTDAKAALAGTMIPMADAKGAALALMVEALAASLTGARHSWEASSFLDAEGPPPGVGQLLIAFDAGLAEGYAARIGALVAAVAAQEGARLPGERRLALRARAEAEGVAIPDAIRLEIDRLTTSGAKP
jgi:(2R)-3-sulfolactate dehydrogenase (NADP+)